MEGSEQFYEFLDSIANKISLNGWGHFRGGLDVKSTPVLGIPQAPCAYPRGSKHNGRVLVL